MNKQKLSKQDRIILDDGDKATRVLFAIFIINGLALLAGIFALVISGGA